MQSMRTLFFLAALGLPWLAIPKPSSSLFVIKHEGWKLLLLSAVLILGLPYLTLLAIVNGYLRAMLIHPSLGSALRFLADNVGSISLVALAEEFFFRGYLQETVFSTFWDKRALGPLSLKNLAASSLFGLAHVVTHLSPLEFLQAFNGLAMGWLVERSGGSIWPAVALHMLSNLVVIWFKLLISLNIPWL